jgi:hypothetical protein
MIKEFYIYIVILFFLTAVEKPITGLQPPARSIPARYFGHFFILPELFRYYNQTQYYN